MTVVRVFFKTNVTVSAVTVSVVKTNVFSILEGTWVRIYAYLHYVVGPGLNFGGPKTGPPEKILRKKWAGLRQKINWPGPRFFNPCRGLLADATFHTFTSVISTCIYSTSIYMVYIHIYSTYTRNDRWESICYILDGLCVVDNRAEK